MQVVKLKNGSKEPDVLVNATMLTLHSLMDTYPIAVYEITMKCRDANHKFFGRMGQILEEFALVNADGSIHKSIRHIVLSAVKGDGMEMILGNPLA